MTSKRDLKLNSLPIPLLHSPRLKTSELKAVSDAFLENATRARQLSLFPLMAMVVADMRGRATGAASMRATGNAAAEQLNRAQKLQYEATKRDQWAKIIRAQSRERAKKALEDAVRNLQDQAVDDARVVYGVEAWFSSQIVGAWTAFETMTGDLWEAALNCHPAGLSELKGKTSGTGDGKMVSLMMLQKYSYNLSTKMGTLLREKRSFDRLEAIRDAYTEAFYTDVARITTLLGEKSVNALAAVRHLIVHRASVVDQRYLDRTKSLPNVPRAAVGKPIVLDGKIVHDLIQPVMQIGIDLIVAVDAWIASH
jgi:hypothetical protein